MNLENSPSSRFMSFPGMKREASRNDADNKKKLRLPFIGFLPNKMRNHFIAGAGEFVGTFCFLFFAFSATQVANAEAAAQSGALSRVPNTGILLYISLAFGFSLAVNAWIFFRISGGLFNPAVTLGLALIGGVTWVRAGVAFVAELLGAMAAAGVVAALFPGEMAVSTSLGPGVSLARGVFIEMFLTAELVFTIFMLAAEKHKSTFIAPVGIGLALFIAELGGVYWTGGSLNPARSFGPCVALASFPSEHWIYWVGPILGTLIATGFYRFVKILEYETANPGQDFDEKEDAEFTFDEDNAASSKDVARPTPDSPTASRDAGQIPGEGGRAFSSGSQGNYTGSSQMTPPRSNGGRMDRKPVGGSGGDEYNYNEQAGSGADTTSPSSVLNRGRPHVDLDGYDKSYQDGPQVEGGEPQGGKYTVQGL